MAAGLSIREDQVASFAEQFEAAVRAATRPEDFVPETFIDAELSLDEVNDALLADLARLEPHGPGNPEPIFLARDVTRRLTADRRREPSQALPPPGQPRPAQQSASAWPTRRSRRAPALDILFSPEHNEWNGNTSIQLRLRDLRATQGFPTTSVNRAAQHVAVPPCSRLHSQFRHA